MSTLGGDPSVWIRQRPLPATGKGRAVVFIGGLGDEVSGIMSDLAFYTPALLPGREETRAYYYCHAGLADMAPLAAPKLIAAHIEAYRRNTPGADVVLLGHSLGASTALKAANLLQEGRGRVFLLTSDPVDRSVTPVRPASVTWWGNAYVTASQSPQDALYALGGRWNHCEGADINLLFRGTDCNEQGYAYIHDYAHSFLMSAGAAKATPGSPRKHPDSARPSSRPPRFSLLDALRREL